MNDKTIAEFRTFCDNYIEASETEWGKTDSPVDLSAATVAKIMLCKFNEILSRAEAVEPLAVLADRKGFGRIQYDAYTDGQKSIYITENEKEDKELITEKEFYAPTYAAAESLARAYLESLDDKGGR